jgi:hypothetical protein
MATRRELPLAPLATPANHITCYDCPSVGNTGKDDATGQLIAWCNAKQCIVAPEFGCDKHPMYYARVKPVKPAKPQT